MKEFLEFRLDTANHCLWRHREKAKYERILLTPKTFGVLQYLVEHAGRLVRHEELLHAVWANIHVQPQAVKKLILDLRTILGDRARKPKCIETAHGLGYRFIAPVREQIARSPILPAPTWRTKLVGRDDELAHLREHLRKTVNGERQIVFITGEPGIGKTTLADEFQHRTSAEVPSTRIARSQCIEGYAGREPYYPMLEALGQLCRGVEGDWILQTLAAQAPTWLVQFPALMERAHRETFQPEIRGATRARMLREIGDALETIAATTPLLLLFEDLQWVDYATVDLIALLARQRGSVRLMLIATSRSLSAVAPKHPLKALKDELLAHDLCHEVVVRPLTEREIGEFLAAASWKGVPPEGLAQLLHLRTEGNPLFMVAVLEHMRERGFVTRDYRGWKLESPLEEIAVEIPQKLWGMIETQIDAISEQEQRALEAASVEAKHSPLE